MSMSSLLSPKFISVPFPSSSTPLNSTTNNISFPFPFSASSFPSSALLKHSQLSHIYSGNRNWVSSRNRVHAKPDTDTDEKFSQKQVSSGSTNGGTTTSSASTSFLSVLCPLLKLFSGGDPSLERNYAFEVATSSLSTLARLPWGSRALSESISDPGTTTLDRPKHLQLFEFEACPFCRRVREAMTELDLSAEVYPCPKGSIKHREMVRSFGGKEQFPFLIDPNTGITMYESGDIVKYLFQRYGSGSSPSTGLLESTLLTGWVPTILRAGRGMSLWEKATPDSPSKKLELFSYENNPYARIVREALCELELPYVLLNVGAGSQRKKLLVDVSGSEEVPYLIDPNSGAQMGDYKKILAYLFETYSAADAT